VLLQQWMIGSVNNELKRIRKEEAVVSFETKHRKEGTRIEQLKPWDVTSCLRGQTWTQEFPNSKQECQPLNCIIRFAMLLMKYVFCLYRCISTSGGRTVGIVRSRTKATDLLLFIDVYTWETRQRSRYSGCLRAGDRVAVRVPIG
jgi:hypothetical protein